MEPEVTITETERGTIQEYRVNGQLYMVKITPNRGRPYYVFDTDGDGYLDMLQDGPAPAWVPQWLLFSW